MSGGDNNHLPNNAQAELRVRNWDKWQSYRRDRGQPPWIKIHRSVMRDPKWISLSDAQRCHLVSIWILAGDRGGLIPNSAQTIKRLCYLKHKPDLNLFIDQGFIEYVDAKVTPDRRQHDAPDTEAETETETEKSSLPVGSAYAFDYGIIKLNEKNLQQWRSAFPRLDLEAELVACAGWAEQKAGSGWFMAVANHLRNRNNQIKLDGELAKQQAGASRMLGGGFA